MAGQAEALCRAIWKHDGRTIARLANRVDPDAADRWGHTPLLMAAQFGDLALVSLLIGRGADVHQGRTHLTPLTLAARRGAGDIVAFLRERGATPSPVTWTYLGDRPALARALGRDPSLARLRDEEGTPLLVHAACALQPAIVSMLLDRGVPVGEATPDGNTALHAVANLRRAPACAGDTARLLLDHGADANARNWSDVTPLHQAVRARNLAVVEVLLAGGADPNARDKRGSTPLRRAVSGTGASSTAGTSALMEPLTRLLLAHGADPEARDKQGKSVRASARDARVRAAIAEPRRRRPRTR